MANPITTLADALKVYGPMAYLITLDASSPHTSRVVVSLDGDWLTFNLGKSAARNALKQPEISLLWPPVDETGYDLIVNGKVAVEEGKDGSVKATATLSKAVLHQPGVARDAASTCEADWPAIGVRGLDRLASNQYWSRRDPRHCVSCKTNDLWRPEVASPSRRISLPFA